MKYLVIGKNTVPISPEKGADLFQAAKQYIKAKIADGTYDCHYVFADTEGGFAITNADSHEEVLSGIMDYPLYPFFSWEVKPLCNWNQSYSKSAELFQKITNQ